ncbi:MAG: 2-C-methyl-D-erythritol 4-phosphate cytidylyltransferase [Bacteroidetes bacterium]|nr:MAG: 2-C-methyl-D-erythritol 4-phosphate cytidylyltransferase [Bacteroidota bacterium]
MKKYAVIVAAGSGTRMGLSTPKQFLLLQGKPIIWYTINAFLDAYDDLQVVLVLTKNHFAEGESIIRSISGHDRIKIVAGGSTRFQSVKNGLSHVEHPSIVFVHDGVRCLITTGLIHRCYQSALDHGNAIPAISSIDSVRIEKDGQNESIDRSRVKLIQTPQTFQSNALAEAFQSCSDVDLADEATVVEKAGGRIHLLEGESTNIKITRPLDLLLAEKILQDRHANETSPKD